MDYYTEQLNDIRARIAALGYHAKLELTAALFNPNVDASQLLAMLERAEEKERESR